MAHYETVIITRQDITAAQAEAVIDNFVSILTKRDGVIDRRENWGLLEFQYKIKKNKKGHYTLLNYTAEDEAVKEMERNIRLSGDVLRFLTIKTENAITEPSVFFKKKESRFSRDDSSSRNHTQDNKETEAA